MEIFLEISGDPIWIWINKIGNYCYRFHQLINCQFDQIYTSFISITMIMYVSVRSTDGIGIPGHVSAHVNTYLYTHTRTRAQVHSIVRIHVVKQ